MSTAISDAWHVLPHGPLEPLADNLWRVQGSLPGMSLKRNMVVVRLADGSLLLHSAIALDEPHMRELETLGTPALMVVPNAGHRLDAPAYKKRFPNLRIFTPEGGLKKVAEVVQVDGGYGDFPALDEVRLEILPGLAAMEGVMKVKSRDGVTLVFNDAVFNMERKRDPLGFLFTTLLGSAPGPRVSRLAKLLYVKDQGAFRRELEKRAETPDLVRVIVAHENVASGQAAPAALRRAATFLHA